MSEVSSIGYISGDNLNAHTAFLIEQADFDEPGLAQTYTAEYVHGVEFGKNLARDFAAKPQPEQDVDVAATILFAGATFNSRYPANLARFAGIRAGARTELGKISGVTA